MPNLNMYSYRDRGRRHSRSRSRERDRSPQQHSLAETTNDPKTVAARIFVGSIVNPIPREQLQRHFSRWGNVVGVSITKSNFGFVQFEKPEEAQACMASGYFTMLDGMKLDIKPAKIGPSGPGTPGSNGGGWPARGGGTRGGKFAERGGFGGSREQRGSPRRDDYYDSYYRGEGRTRDSYEPTSGDPYNSDYYREYYDRERERDREGGNGHYYSSQSYTNENRTSLSDIYSTDVLDPLDPTRPNDVEIVVPNKLQRSYAENVESQLKRFDMLVDLLFPPADITPQQVLNDLSARRCLYAIFITPDNEKLRSLTVNILHGETQEHRNMPIDDAMRLIQQNFDVYVKKSRLRNGRQVVPREIRNLLLDLLEMRSLSMGDLDKMIKYLRERQNSLVDDQIEQKRETAGNQSTAIARSVAVTYPGYNYLTTSMPGAVSAAPASHTTVTPANVLAAGTAAQAAVAAATVAVVPGSVGIMQAPQNAVNPAGTAYAPGYGSMHGMAPQTMVEAYSISSQMGATSGLIPGSNPVPEPQVHSKQSELQERILNLMKSQGGLGVSAALPAPTGVPAPSGVPPPRMMQASVWGSNSKANDTVGKAGQSSQAVYNPWSQ